MLLLRVFYFAMCGTLRKASQVQPFIHVDTDSDTEVDADWEMMESGSAMSTNGLVLVLHVGKSTPLLTDDMTRILLLHRLLTFCAFRASCGGSS